MRVDDAFPPHAERSSPNRQWEDDRSLGISHRIVEGLRPRTSDTVYPRISLQRVFPATRMQRRVSSALPRHKFSRVSVFSLNEELATMIRKESHHLAILVGFLSV